MTQPADIPPPADDAPQDRTLAGHPRQRSARGRRAVAVTPAMLDGAPEFAPVPRGSSRYDGWTPERQRVFVKLLAEHGCVRRAAHALGMSEVGAYLLRRAPGGEAFARAWAEAQAVGVEKLADVALERAFYGVQVPIYHKGEQVGERRWYNDRLLMWVLRHKDPDRYAGPTGHRVPPHVRKALRAEWEAEKAAEAEAGAEEFGRMIEAMRERLEAAGDLDAVSLADLRGQSVAAQMILLGYGRSKGKERDTSDPLFDGE